MCGSREGTGEPDPPPFFGVQNFEFQYFWGCQKNKYFWGYEDFVDIFFGSSQNWTILRGHFYAFSSQKWTIFRGHFYAFQGLFLRSWYRMGILFWVAKISNIFLWCLKFLIFFGGEG